MSAPADGAGPLPDDDLLSRPMTTQEITDRLKAKLIKQIEHDKPSTERGFRLCAIRVANELMDITGDVNIRNEVYEALLNMMGLETRK